MNFFENLKFLLFLVFFFISVSNCNSIQKYSDNEFAEFDSPKKIVEDPWENTNRSIMKFNDFFDINLVLPMTKKYIIYTSEDFRKKVDNVLLNMTAPSDIAISVTQLDGQSTFVNSWRFAINSTIGIFGLFDIAGKLGLPHMNKKFSDTLELIGIPRGNYVVMPFFGPSFARTTVDFPVKMLLNSGLFSEDNTPFSYTVFKEGTLIRDFSRSPAINYGFIPFTIVSFRAALLNITEDIDEISIDRYKAYRDMFAQYAINEEKKRIKIIKEGVYDSKFWNENIKSASEYCIDNSFTEECKEKNIANYFDRT